LEDIYSVTGSDITSNLSPLSVDCGNNYVALEVSDFRSSSDDCYSAACLICRQDSGNGESTKAGSLFSSTPIIVGTPEVWVIPRMPKMPFPMEGYGDSKGGGKYTVR